MASEPQSNQSLPKPEAGVEGEHYDAHIIPAETAARQEREGDQFKTTPSLEEEARTKTDDQTDSGSIDSTEGYTVDKEGLINNYAIEPEMYVDQPGDMAEKSEMESEGRAEDLREANQDKEGLLTEESDRRGKGPGII